MSEIAYLILKCDYYMDSKIYPVAILKETPPETPAIGKYHDAIVLDFLHRSMFPEDSSIILYEKENVYYVLNKNRMKIAEYYISKIPLV